MSAGFPADDVVVGHRERRLVVVQADQHAGPGLLVRLPLATRRRLHRLHGHHRRHHPRHRRLEPVGGRHGRFVLNDGWGGRERGLPGGGRFDRRQEPDGGRAADEPGGQSGEQAKAEHGGSPTREVATGRPLTLYRTDQGDLSGTRRVGGSRANRARCRTELLRRRGNRNGKRNRSGRSHRNAAVRADPETPSRFGRASEWPDARQHLNAFPLYRRVLIDRAKSPAALEDAAIVSGSAKGFGPGLFPSPAVFSSTTPACGIAVGEFVRPLASYALGEWELPPPAPPRRRNRHTGSAPHCQAGIATAALEREIS